MFHKFCVLKSGGKTTSKLGDCLLPAHVRHLVVFHFDRLPPGHIANSLLQQVWQALLRNHRTIQQWPRVAIFGQNTFNLDSDQASFKTEEVEDEVVNLAGHRRFDGLLAGLA